MAGRLHGPGVFTLAGLSCGHRPVSRVEIRRSPGHAGAGALSPVPACPATVLTRDAVYTAEIPAAPSGGTSHIPAESPGSTLASFLEGITRPQRTDLTLLLGERCVHEQPLLWLPSNWWPHQPEARTWVAALVLPGSEEFLPWLAEALSGGAEILPAGPPGHPSTKVASIYAALSASCRWSYQTPRVEYLPQGFGTAQVVRLPGALATSDGRVANCLDLTLWLAGCLETLGVSPLIFFTGAPEGMPEHAFLGWWNQPGRRLRPLLDDADGLQKALHAGELDVLESTGLCAGAEALEFAGACARARRRLDDSVGVHAVDIAACRPPIGMALPLRLAWDAGTARVLQSAEAISRRHGQGRREVIHLLCALLLEPSDLLAGLLVGAGISPARLLELVRAGLPEPVDTPIRHATRNYEATLREARAYARRGGRVSVSEGDFLWALLENPSRNLAAAVASAGGDLTGVVHELDKVFPRPGGDLESRQLLAPE